MSRRCLSVLLCAGLASSCGTGYTRGYERSVFGAYPFYAVGHDFYWIGKAFGPPQELLGTQAGNAWCFIGGLLSLPFDLVLDAVLLPIDLGAWIAGYHKSWPTRI